MKIYSYIVVFLCLISMSSYSWADVGSCARYKLKVFTQDGTGITGFIQIGDYDEKVSEWKEEKILQRIKRNAKSHDNKIVIYEKIQTINFPFGNKHYKFKYSAVALDDIKTVSKDEVTSIVKLGVMPCEHMKRYGGDRYKIHYTTQVIDGLTQNDINLLQKKPYAKISFTSSPESYDSNFCLSYNKKVRKKKLKKICTRSAFYLTKQRKVSSDNFEAMQKKHLAKKIKELRKQGIIFFNMYGYY